MLLLPDGPHWGTFDPASGPCRLAERHARGAEDLVNLAAIETLRHGGQVALADLAGAGIQEPMAADFKYAPPSMRPQRTH